MYTIQLWLFIGIFLNSLNRFEGFHVTHSTFRFYLLHFPLSKSCIMQCFLQGNYNDVCNSNLVYSSHKAFTCTSSQRQEYFSDLHYDFGQEKN